MTRRQFPNVLLPGSGSGGPDIFSVVDYGAKGDFSTDDTAAFQAAINACVAQGLGGTVLIPQRSSYKISGALTFSAMGSCNILFQGGVSLYPTIHTWVLPYGWSLEGESTGIFSGGGL